MQAGEEFVRVDVLLFQPELVLGRRAGRGTYPNTTLNLECCQVRICSTISGVIRPSARSRSNSFFSHRFRTGSTAISGIGTKLPFGAHEPSIARACKCGCPCESSPWV